MSAIPDPPTVPLRKTLAPPPHPRHPPEEKWLHPHTVGSSSGWKRAHFLMLTPTPPFKCIMIMWGGGGWLTDTAHLALHPSYIMWKLLNELNVVPVCSFDQTFLLGFASSFSCCLWSVRWLIWTFKAQLSAPGAPNTNLSLLHSDRTDQTPVQGGDLQNQAQRTANLQNQA